MNIALDAIRECLDGAVPGIVATAAPDGTPNISYVSQVHYVDGSHIALSFQFFNKTRENILVNPRAQVMVINPETAARFRLYLDYVRTDCTGPLFESMKAKLAGIASHTGMADVFKLRGADVYRVRGIDRVPGTELPSRPRRNLLSPLRTLSMEMSRATDLASLLDETLLQLERLFDIRQSMVLMLDASGKRLYTVASRGYAVSGVGSEILLGCGVIGVAAQERTPIRVTHMTAEYAYGRAIRESAERAGMAGNFETAIPFPGLPDTRSQLAAPIVAGRDLLGVLFVESPQDLRFGYDDEDALVAVAAQLGTTLVALQQQSEAGEPEQPANMTLAAARGTPVIVRHYPADGSIFIGDDYLIKGVAGAIFRKLLAECAAGRRSEFSNRELRLDPAIGLPDLADNLEARLLLLQRRLTERTTHFRIEKTGRGRFRLVADRPFTLTDA